MSALGKVVRSGVGRRRVQSFVMALTTLAAVTSSVLSLGLLTVVQAPFDHAFASRDAAHLAVQFDGTKAGAAQAAATAHAAGVTESAGPYPITTNLDATVGPDCTATMGPGLPFAGSDAPPAAVTTRPDLAHSPMDQLVLDDGRWPTAANEIVLSQWPYDCRGKSVVFSTLPGKPAFVVVGRANSLTSTATGFVTGAGFDRLTAAGAHADSQMLYRFAHAGTDAEIATDKQAIAAAAPAGAVEGAHSYLTERERATGNAKVFVPFLVVFGVLGLFLSVLIIAIVVSGAVVSAIRRIGILKALGFTPSQVARAYAAQALIPASVGVVLGTVFGNLLAVPVLNGTSHEVGAAGTQLPVWVSLLVPLGTLVIVGVTALIPALRAGRLPAAQTLVVGRAPKAERGRAAQRLAARLPLPRAMSLGLAQPFARPARAALVGGAVLFGAVSATFAMGLETAFAHFQDQRTGGFNAGSLVVVPSDQTQSGPGPGRVRNPNDPDAPHLDPARVAAAIASVPGTKAAFGWGDSGATVVGTPAQTEVDTVYGDLSWTGLELIAGRWYAAPGEAVVSDRLATTAGIHVGDTVTAVQAGKSLPLKVVGIDFDTHDGGQIVTTDAASFTAGGLTPRIDQFNVQLGAHVSGQTWSASAAAALSPLGAAPDHNMGGNMSDVVMVMSALVATLTLMLVLVAALGVLNTVVQDTRERIHDLGVFKALGMTPKQTIAMVMTSVALSGLIAGLIGVPIGAALERATLDPMQNAVGMHLPASVTHSYTPGLVGPLLAGGMVIALLGALLPAGWAARSRTATALRTE
ncbi:ABC transporter permease [Catenulispora subtropica]|uniref:ABC3 transporter permease C-terminal domain-containing protein n=1 Tax=Catenulispora subtropica TaxID=450798 RepID=A0ABN2RGJ4_9ACTN